MPSYCCALNCSNKDNKISRDNGLSFHQFPSNYERRLKWCQNIRRDDGKGGLWMPSTSCRSYLCSNHFENDMFVRFDTTKKLISTAIPTIFDLPKCFLKASTDCKRGRRKRYLNESKEEDIEIKPVNSSQGVKAKNYFKEHRSHADTGDCSGSAFCSHYISLIEEKARNHKLNRKVEELEERIMCLEDILMKKNLPITYIKQEVDEDQESNHESMDDNA